jgi:adenylate cyclase
MEATFCFVDVAGFTALTETHGPDAAADLITKFKVLVEAALGADGRIVDRAGDAFFVVMASPEAGVRFLTRLFEAAAREPDFPDLRAGLHHGEALEREGSYFGADVNLAARVAAHASGGSVLATAGVVPAAEKLGVAVTPLGPRSFRNVRAPVELYSLGIASGGAETVIDPVCRMRVEPARAPARLRFGERDYWFCSLQCAGLFAESPEAFVGRAEPS